VSFHSNYEQWLKMAQRENCPVCRNLPMPEGMVDIVELPSSWLSAEPIECLKGACHLTAKQHVVELFELSESELLPLMKEVQLCAKALKEVTHAIKINYEIHGNSLPHLHVHLYPRTMDDPFPGNAIDYHAKSPLYGAGEFDSFVSGMRQAIARWMGTARSGM
jgi:diadenosine tetraphosphate (Ap4A) HIT family hydrolase